MKQRYKLYALALMGTLALTAQAQTSYNAGILMENQLNGTARFVGMGGAMSALGGDLSTMSTNPAGIGLYRSSDVAFTVGWFNPSSESSFNGESHKDNVSKFSFDQIGFVYSSKIGNRTAVRFLNFGFNYRKVNNFNSKFQMGGLSPNNESLSRSMVGSLLALGNTPADFNTVLDGDDNPFGNSNYGWLNVMGGMTGFVTGDEASSDFYYWNADRIGFRSENRGGINAYDFNVALNVKDRVYLGLTIGVYDVDYRRYSSYYEDLIGSVDMPTMNLENWYRLEGSGLDAKFGIIVRPFEYSPLRIGLAVHTPVWYNLSDVFSSRMTMFGLEGQDWSVDTEGYVDWYDYNLRTPWKFNLSAAYTFGQNVALDAEYEYADYSSAKFRDTGGYDLDGANQTISEDLKGVSSFRIGLEARVLDDMSLRVGYNYMGALYDKNAFKFNDPQGINTDVDFMNNFEAHNLSFGLGFRFGGFYADMAYVYTHQKADFHPYTNYVFDEPDPTASVTHANNRAVLTLGYRF